MTGCPLTLRVDVLEAMLNAELADHPVYDGFELQWFDDAEHGTGMLAFLSRRDDRAVDYYADPALDLDTGHYSIGGGTRSWTTTTFEVARLRVTEDGVDAEVRFTDVDGRVIDIRVDDRDGRARRRAGFLAPVSAMVEAPTSLMLVWMPGFDLVRRSGTAPVVRIEGRDAAIGRLPGAALHRRHLVKYASPVIAVDVNRDGGVDAAGTRVARSDDGVGAVEAEGGGHRARLACHPPMPDPADVADGTVADGAWEVAVDDAVLTVGRWRIARTGDVAEVELEVTDRWHPHRLPLLMQVVTTVIPVFRRWPTTYRWRGTVDLGGAGAVTGGWERTGDTGADAYRRATS